MNRNLDGCYFRVQRDGKWQNICFSDLSAVERNKVMENKSEEWLKNLCFYLADVISGIGEQFDLVRMEE